MNNFGLFFQYGGKVYRLPINPAELPVTRNNDNNEHNVLGIGGITIPRIPKQKEVTISSYFPGRVTAAVLTPNGFIEPEVYINFFQDAMKHKRVLTYTPVRYMEDGKAFCASDSGFKCIVQSFDTKEKGGETGDFYYDLTIREYRDYSPMEAEIEIQIETPAVEPTPVRETPPAQIVVGSTVIANGNYYYSSWGKEPHGTARGEKYKVSAIVSEDPTRKCPYHIATLSGGARGWMTRDQLQLV